MFSVAFFLKRTFARKKAFTILTFLQYILPFIIVIFLDIIFFFFVFYRTQE